MVNALIDSLIKIGKNEKVMWLIVDDGEICSALKALYPDRTINVGISECNAVSVGAGLASCGNIPIIIGGNSFMAYRAYEFIRDQLCMQNRNVKVIGIGAGMAISVLGNTQHATEDLASLRVLPNLTIMTPATPTEVKEMVTYSVELEGPVFIRVGRSSGEDFYKKDCEFAPYCIQKIMPGSDLVILGTGSIVCDAIAVAKRIKNKSVGVINVHTIQPLDKSGLILLSHECNKWLSVEEHNLNGGLGSALMEIIGDEKLPVELHRMGLLHTFAKGYGTHSEIKTINRLGIEDIYIKCMEILKCGSNEVKTKIEQ